MSLGCEGPDQVRLMLIVSLRPPNIASSSSGTPYNFLTHFSLVCRLMNSCHCSLRYLQQSYEWGGVGGSYEHVFARSKKCLTTIQKADSASSDVGGH